MLHLYIKDSKADVDLNLSTYVTRIHGDSGMGKTLLCSNILRIQQQVTDASKIFIVNSRQLFDLIAQSNSDIIVIDKMEQYLHGDDLANCIYQNSTKHFIIFGRSAMFIPGTLFDMAKLSIKVKEEHLYFRVDNCFGDLV